MIINVKQRELEQEALRLANRTEEQILADKTTEEKAWRDSELLKTDELAKLPDFPKSVELLQYRQELRDYPASLDFPNGIRPIKLY